MPDDVDRILFRRATSGGLLVRGELVRRLQAALKGLGVDVGTVDGIFGRDTEAAIMEWRNRVGSRGGAEVSADDWKAITKMDPPSLFERCLQLTSHFEGHGFRKVAGNFDGAGITWGVIGFTLRSGSLGEVVRAIEKKAGGAMAEAMGASKKRELLKALSKKWPQQEKWADSISIPPRNIHVAPAWETAFDKLGALEAAQAAQLGVAEERYWSRARQDAERFGLASELGMALCFDIAVQNGGVDHAREENSILRRIEQQDASAERDRRLIIADVVAENSLPRWIEDVRARKRAIASGAGEVHQALYAMADWALSEASAFGAPVIGAAAPLLTGLGGRAPSEG